MNTRTITKQITITIYSDGSAKCTETKLEKRNALKRDARGKFRSDRATAVPERHITCPTCGTDISLAGFGCP